MHGIEALLNLGGGKGDTFISFRVGITKIRTEVNSVDCIFSPYHYGFASGYDFLITSWLTAGFDGSFMYVQGSSLNKGGFNNELKGFSVLNFLATLQLKF